MKNISRRGLNRTVVQQTRLLKGNPVCGASVGNTDSLATVVPGQEDCTLKVLCPLRNSFDYS